MTPERLAGDLGFELVETGPEPTGIYLIAPLDVSDEDPEFDPDEDG